MRALAMLPVLFALGCASSGGEVAPGAVAPPRVVLATPEAPVLFAYETLSGEALTSASLRGRISLIGFVTTYDLASQAEVRFLAGLLRSHTPRINVALLVLEQPENRPLVEAFVTTLRLPYPVAIADASTIAGEGPFAGLHHVPSIVVLDAAGREVFRRIGLINEEGLEEIVRAVELASGPQSRR